MARPLLTSLDGGVSTTSIRPSRPRGTTPVPLPITILRTSLGISTSDTGTQGWVTRWWTDTLEVVHGNKETRTNKYFTPSQPCSNFSKESEVGQDFKPLKG